MTENLTVTPPITVITVVRNAAATIQRCIESVIAQRIRDLQYVIIDGQSADGTLDILTRYSDAIDVLVSERDSGLYDAMNKGLTYARGRLIHFLNADDCYADADVLEKVLAAAADDAVFYGQLRYVDGMSIRHLGAPFSLAAELRCSNVPQPTLFVPREFYSAVGNFDTSLRVAADYDMVLRLAKRFSMRYLPFVVSEMYAGGISCARPDLTFGEAMRVSRRHGLRVDVAWRLYAERRLKWWLHSGAKRLGRLIKGEHGGD